MSEEDLMNELFVLPIESEIGKNFLEYADMLINYSEANRGIAYFRIKNILKEIFGPKNVKCKILSDILHSKYRKNMFEVSSFRGVQQLYPADNPHFIRENINDFSIVGGETRTDSLLVTAGELASKVNYSCAHGVGKFSGFNYADIDDKIKFKSVLCNKKQSKEEILNDSFNSKIAFSNIIENRIINEVAYLKPIINLWEKSDL